jgi:hypothetical protein
MYEENRILDNRRKVRRKGEGKRNEERKQGTKVGEHGSIRVRDVVPASVIRTICLALSVV